MLRNCGLRRDQEASKRKWVNDFIVFKRISNFIIIQSNLIQLGLGKWQSWYGSTEHKQMTIMPAWISWWRESEVSNLEGICMSSMRSELRPRPHKELLSAYPTHKRCPRSLELHAGSFPISDATDINRTPTIHFRHGHTSTTSMRVCVEIDKLAIYMAREEPYLHGTTREGRARHETSYEGFLHLKFEDVRRRPRRPRK